MGTLEEAPMIAVRSSNTKYIVKLAIIIFSFFSMLNCTPAHASVYGPALDEAQGSPVNTPEENDKYRLNPTNPGKDIKLKKTVTALEVLYQGLNVLDTVETISCVHKPTCQEGNPILGKRPSDAKVIIFKLASSGIHYMTYRHQIKRSLKTALAFEVITNTLQGVVCGLNFRYAF
jgi:hypothetical protein